MNTSAFLIDLADRAEVSVKSLPTLTSEQLNGHPGGHPNSIAWLLWHTGRVLDGLTTALSEKPQQWEEFGPKLGLGELGDGLGVGQSAEEAAQIRIDDADALVEYVAATLAAFRDYVAPLANQEGAFEEVIGEFQGAPQTRYGQLTLAIVDALRHIDQALYAAGMPQL